ncbi:hypothetical protein M441DRAFT_61965 [Trichoderma asperellum CBS 433.97]|uniref:Uncharacterized protein n=1 Tax=Trichoderma asperellum (strain ATCC 204424 / CBS 433.97 / NBRC 101777) TaxID=1042311 RepID=A0A2T3YVE3_TRIA4|nr:hypothetical protein M441DRAFT_61965 [Trichoderma asperellum CBS 433.97]PTB36497.1 hypothetical protein M441DRAFT_61965 [Trichoderma asperellum CBS 433.97]WVH32627.1 hypothetical protein [Trichoderma asperellum]
MGKCTSKDPALSLFSSRAGRTDPPSKSNGGPPLRLSALVSLLLLFISRYHLSSSRAVYMSPSCCLIPVLYQQCADLQPARARRLRSPY